MGERLGGVVTCYLDTHVVIWLCQGQFEKLTSPAVAALADSELLVSPMVLLEMQYLYEIHRLLRPPQVLFNQLERQIGLRLCDHPFSAVVASALHENWTRDPFDRVIVAHARSVGSAPLVSSDEWIRENYSQSIW